MPPCKLELLGRQPHMVDAKKPATAGYLIDAYHSAIDKLGLNNAGSNSFITS